MKRHLRKEFEAILSYVVMILTLVLVSVHDFTLKGLGWLFLGTMIDIWCIGILKKYGRGLYFRK